MIFATATAVAHPNIAFVKYWGNIDGSLRLPQNGSISMNLAELTTRTVVTFDSSLPRDIFDLNGIRQGGAALERVSQHLNLIRGIRGFSCPAHILSESSFPVGAGLASSASAFAALTVATVRAAGIEMSEKDLSRLARRGSGSAARSIPAGFVEWLPGSSDLDSYAVSIAPPQHWELVDCITIVESAHKQTGSSEGHHLAQSSPLQKARVLDAERRLVLCREAIQKCDFHQLAELIELDSNLLHAIAVTSTPPVFYWLPPTLVIMQEVRAWRRAGIPCAYTIDAGPNVHVICESSAAKTVKEKLKSIPGVNQVLLSGAGGGAELV